MKTVDPNVSVVIPVYNVGAYLARCLDSLTEQTLREIEIICVDDGSTDGSGAIADSYAEKDSRITVIHQTNAGAGAARNAGLDLARGEYLFFFDPDDSCSPKMLEKMYRRAKKKDADVVVAGKITVDAETGRTVARYGFHRDIWRFPHPFSGEDAADYIFTFAKSVPWDKMFRRKFILDNGLRFQNTRRCNDVYFVDMSLALARRIALCPQAYYRYSLDRAGSLQSNKDKHPLVFLEAYSALERGLKEKGVFGTFGRCFARVFWRTALFNMRAFKDAANVSACYRSVHETLARLASDGIDLSFDPLLPMRTCSLYRLALQEPSPEMFVSAMRTLRQCDDAGADDDDMPGTGRGCLSFRGLIRRYLPIPVREVVKMFRMRVLRKKPVTDRDERTLCADARKCGLLRLDFLSLRQGEAQMEFSYYRHGNVPPEELPGGAFLVAAAGEKHVSTTVSPGVQCSLRASGGFAVKTPGRRFACKIPLPTDGPVAVEWAFPDGGDLFTWSFVKYGLYAPLTSALKSSFFRENGWIVRLRDGKLLIGRDDFFLRWRSRLRLAAETVLNPSLACFKAGVLSAAARVVRHFAKRPLWLFADRPDRADDNARALFEYACRQPVTDVSPRCVFAVSRRSPDYRELRRIGECVDIGSFRYKVLFLASDALISAYRTPVQRRPFPKKTADLLRGFFSRRYRFFYLRHGIALCDQSNEIGRSYLNARVLFSSVVAEYNETGRDVYGYADRNVKLCGMARYDKLYDAKEKNVTFMPTWRAYLTEGAGSDTLSDRESFRSTPFCVNYRAVLGDPAFAAACGKAGYRIRVMLHPNMRAALPELGLDPSVEIIPSDVSYRDVFASSGLLVTDYSSVAFDMAYLRKPVLYYQFDRDDFFSRQYEKGYFDWDRDGFGEVETTPEALKARISEYLENGCCMKPGYVGRVDGFFAFTDKGNCKRVYEAILGAAREDFERQE